MKAALAAALARIEAKLDQLLTEQGVSYDMPARYDVTLPTTTPVVEAPKYDGPPLWDDDDETGMGVYV